MTAWTDFVKAYASEHGLRYMEAVKPASILYKSKKMTNTQCYSSLKQCHGEVEQLKKVADKYNILKKKRRVHF